jgi:hypothetical protein
MAPNHDDLFDALLSEFPKWHDYIARKRKDRRAASFYEAVFHIFTNTPSHTTPCQCDGTDVVDLMITKAAFLSDKSTMGFL